MNISDPDFFRKSLTKPPLSNTGANCKPVATEGQAPQSETVTVGGKQLTLAQQKKADTQAANLLKSLQGTDGDENYTPAWLMDCCRDFLGGFDLDMFSCPKANEIVKAERYFTKDESCLDADLSAYLKKWCNPPYSRLLIKLAAQKVLQTVHIGETLMLTNSSTSAQWYASLKKECSAYLTFNARIQFDSPFRDPADKSKNEYSQTLFYFGDRLTEFADHFRKHGDVAVPFGSLVKCPTKTMTFRPKPRKQYTQEALLSESLKAPTNASLLMIESKIELKLAFSGYPFEIQPKKSEFVKYSGGLDWIQGILPNISLNEKEFIKNEIELIFKDSFDPKDFPFFSGRQFLHCSQTSRGAKIAFNDLPDQKNRCEAYLSIGGQVLAGCKDPHLLLRFLRFLDKLRFRPTRLDINIDDFTKSLSFSLIERSYDAALHHGFDDIWQYSKQKKGVYAGKTLYLGSPKADKMIRLYDKSIESGGEIDSMRLESQLKDEYCRDAWVFLCRSTEATFGQTCVNITINCIDFYIGDRQNKIRCLWWQDFHDSVNSEIIKLSCGKALNSIERSQEWIKNGGCGRVLATIQEFYEHTESDFYEWLQSMIDYGRTKLKTSHFSQIRSACALLNIDFSISRDDTLAGFF